MSTSSEILSARESVWEYRIRQRIVLESIVLAVGNVKEQARAKQFLEAMEQAHPKLFEDIDQLVFEFLNDMDQHDPELFDPSEYAKPKGRKTALKLPRDVVWEEKIISRAAREYTELFHPCDNLFNNAMTGLQYLSKIHPKLFAQARERAIEQKELILTGEIYCKCDCASAEECMPADNFKMTGQGRFAKVSNRITNARKSLAGGEADSLNDWQFFLNRVTEIAPDMLESV